MTSMSGPKETERWKVVHEFDVEVGVENNRVLRAASAAHVQIEEPESDHDEWFWTRNVETTVYNAAGEEVDWDEGAVDDAEVQAVRAELSRLVDAYEVADVGDIDRFLDERARQLVAVLVEVRGSDEILDVNRDAILDAVRVLGEFDPEAADALLHSAGLMPD